MTPMRTALAVLVGTALLVGSASMATASPDPAAPDPAGSPLAAAVTTQTADPPAVTGDGDVAPLVPVADDALTAALADGDITVARYALERARTLFTPQRVERRYGAVAAPDPHDATLILRDLAARADALAPEARADAARLLARPTDGRADPDGSGYTTKKTAVFCTIDLCLHWARVTRDAPDLKDSDSDTVPDWVETTAAVFEHVWRVEVGDYGYRPPRSDRGSRDNGGDARLDVYLADLGADRLYGYCTSDDPRFRRVVSGYCVVDDDFSRTQFHAAAMDSLRVTAAHEFFHAVQFAYDAYEDTWLVEGTAAWIEDEVYDSVNDNYRYLRGSALTNPQLPLDFGDYQPWIFFRFMSEHLGRGGSDAPEVIREVWRRVDATQGSRNEYSLQAVARVAAAHHRSFRKLFAGFGWANAFPAQAYEEGGHYPRAPMTRSFTLTASAPGTGAQAVTVHHLANRDITVRPGSSLPARRRLRISFDLPDRVRGAEATVTVVHRNGGVQASAVRLGHRGNGVITVPFARAKVSRVLLTMTNASTRMRCHRRTVLSCAGVPVDDYQRFAFSARAIR